MRRRKLFGAFSIFAVLATVVVIGASSVSNPASAWVGPNSSLTSTVNLDCLATAPVVGDVPTTQSITLTTQAPGKVEAGETFDILAQSPAQTAPADFTGYTINFLTNLEVRIPLPAGATRVAGEGIVSATGFNYGSGATFTWDGTNYILKTTGNIAGGSNFQLPQVKIRLQATGAPGSVITPKVGGNSKANFGFSLTVNGVFPSPIGTTSLPIACWPKNPNPTLSSTTIIPIDTLGPAITITGPIDAGTYGLNAIANAAYSCNDGANGTGVATCTGPVASGAAIDTSSLGAHSFTVNSTDLKGNASAKTVTYNVVDLPTVTVNPVWTTEGSSAGFLLNLSKPWPTPVSVNFNTSNGTATAPGDYATTTGSRTFTPNTIATGVISVPTVGNATYQGNRNFNLQLSGISGALLGTSSVEGRIIDNETPPPAAVGKTVTEGVDPSVDFDVSLPFDPGVTVNVSYQTVNGFAIAGNDYQATSGTLTFNSGGPLTQVVSVPVIDDGQDDGYAVDFSLAVTNVATAEVGQPGLAVIIDNDGDLPPAVNVGANIGDSSIVEGDDSGRSAWVSVRLDKPVTAPVTFLYETSDGTATAASKDYKAEGKLLTFEPGQTTRTINITVLPDIANEGDEEFYIDLTFVGGGNPIGDAQSVVTIIDDDNPTASDYVVSVGDAQMYEGNADLGQVDLPVTINKKRPNGAVDEDVEVQIDIAYGTASVTDVFVKDLSYPIVFPGGVNKNVQIKVRGDTAIEPDEALTVTASATINTPGSVSFGKPVGTLTIRDDDGIAGPPLAPKAATSTTKLGYVDFTWGAPNTGQPPTGYEWRVSTDVAMDTEPWINTGIGLTRHIEHNCGQGATCQYQVRTINPVGSSAPSGVVSGTGLEDLLAPSLFVFTPKPGANVEDYGALTYNGLIGTDFGDAKTITAKVFACNCTNIAPTQTLSPTIVGAGWSASGAALGAGVYTLQVVQTDWAGHISEVVRTFETRPAIFVSPLGDDTTGTGTAGNPFKTILKGLNTTTVSKNQVAVGQGVYPGQALGGTQGGRTINGGFDQYAGWVRPGSAGVVGTPSTDLTNIEAVTAAAVFNNLTGVTFNGLKFHGTNIGLGAGSSVYGVRAINGTNVTFQNVKVIADSGVAGTNGTNGASGASGGGGTGGGTGGEPCTSYIPNTVSGGAAGTGGSTNGGAGGDGRCNNNGNPGAAGAASGGTGGAGGVKSNGAVVVCNDGGVGIAGGAGTAGAAGTTGGTAGTSGTAGATWSGTNGGNGVAGTAGKGGGGGGGGGGQGNLFGGCGGNDTGGSGGGGGAGGVGGGLGTAGTAGGGSFGVYVSASTVNLDAQTVVVTGIGGSGGAGGNGGAGGSGGAGGTGGSVTNQANGGTLTGNASPTFCFLTGLFGISACFADAGPGGGGAGGSAGGGGSGGGGGYGGPSAPVLTTSAGVVNVNGATLTKAAGGLGGASGLAGPNGTVGPGGTLALGAWSAAPQAGAAGAAAIGAPAAGGNGTAGFSCSRWDNGVCTP